jgi:exonuclease III
MKIVTYNLNGVRARLPRVIEYPDRQKEFNGAAFQVTNPNAASGCGCGTSFSV